MMKATHLIVLVVAACAAAPAAGDDTYWNATTGNWSNDDNWSNGEPNINDHAYVNNHGTVTITDEGERCQWLTLGNNASEGGNVVMSSGHLLHGLSLLVGGYGSGTFTQNGGRVTEGYPSSVGVGIGSGSSGTYNLNSGVLTTSYLDPGFRGLGTFTQTGGTCTVTQSVRIGGDSPEGHGTYAISGGTLSATNMNVYANGSATFTVTGDDPIIHLGSYLQNSNGTLESRIDAGGLSTIAVTETAWLEGTWNVEDLGAPLGTFDVLTATDGIFAYLDVHLPGADWSWGIANGDTLWVEHVPEPTTLSLLLLGGLSLLRRPRRLAPK
ncbi:MAG: PEP-CTERM sorting domain-containing protein [Planctomycetota bacterium]